MTQSIPELFREIIKHDAARPDTSERVVSFETARELKAWKTIRYQLSDAAEKFIQRQRKSD